MDMLLLVFNCDGALWYNNFIIMLSSRLRQVLEGIVLACLTNSYVIWCDLICIDQPVSSPTHSLIPNLPHSHTLTQQQPKSRSQQTTLPSHDDLQIVLGHSLAGSPHLHSFKCISIHNKIQSHSIATSSHVHQSSTSTLNSLHLFTLHVQRRRTLRHRLRHGIHHWGLPHGLRVTHQHLDL